MAKPAILAVDDDAPVLRSIERDLRSRYAKDYRIVAAGSGQEALDTTKQLTARGDVIALFLVDQRMPLMTGIEFLSEAVDLQPDAKRVLLTAYADTDVAIRAINEIRLDHGFVVTGDELLTDGWPPAGWGLQRQPFFLETSLPGVFAAGDVRHRSVKRIASAVGEGAMAVALVHQYRLSL